MRLPQVGEIIKAANLDAQEMARVMGSLNQILVAKDAGLSEARFQVVKLKKAFNDSLQTFTAKLKDLGIPKVCLCPCQSLRFFAPCYTTSHS